MLRLNIADIGRREIKVIEFKDVSFTYEGRKTGINHVNFHIKEGEVVLFCGESGCGKSTITRLMNGLIPHFYKGNLQGEITLSGVRNQDRNLYEINENLGNVFQNPRTQFFNLDTKDEIMFALENQNRDKGYILERFEQTISRFSMEHLLGKNIYKLSGGEQQKIACASAYCSNPDIFIFDEPSSNLDEQSTVALGETLKLLKREGKTIVIAEHRLYFLMDVVDRIIYMEEGEIKETFTKEEFLALSSEKLQEKGLRSREKPVLHPKFHHEVVLGNAITIKNAKVTYQSPRREINYENLQIPRGEIVALTGTNGRGKSTLLRVLAGLQEHSKEQIEMDGVKLGKRARIKDSYFVMQDVNHQLFTESVLQEVSLGAHVRLQERIPEILEELQLEQVKKVHPRNLSGGQRQRVVIASAMSSGKKIVLLDEPTSGLDHKQMENVANSLIKLRKEVDVILIVTHDMEFINRCCTMVMKL